MRFVPYHELNEMSNVIVDGPRNDHTLLALSHWPRSGTPWELKADLSAQIVFRYLDRPDLHVPAEAVSNNHFDEDGLVSLFSILNPKAAMQHKDVLQDVASAGDFGTYRLRDAARIAFVIAAFGDAEKSPLPDKMFVGSYPEVSGNLYREMLERLPAILLQPEDFRSYWEEQEQDLRNSENAIQKGIVKIEEVPALDLAIVTLPETHPHCHQWAIHNATGRFRILSIAGRKYGLTFRYETWVQYISTQPIPRVDLNPLAAQLSELEGKPWKFDGVDAIVPSLHLVEDAESRIPQDEFRARVKAFLENASPAWQPFDNR